MSGPVTDPRVASDRHDAVLLLALGALQAVRRFEASLQPRTTQLPLSSTDPAVLAALGVVALGRRLSRWLESSEAPAHAAAAPTPSPHEPPELLR